jgi:hypothetical protein
MEKEEEKRSKDQKIKDDDNVSCKTRIINVYKGWSLSSVSVPNLQVRNCVVATVII